MRTRVLDLDGSVVHQQRLLHSARANVLPLRDWGPSLRIACSHGAFRRFEEELTRLAESEKDAEPYVNFVGSGDYHHVSLALLRRLRWPCNLLVIDNHPDWMRAIPFLHCGTWLNHAAHLPQVERVFHVGGDVDFDNAYRWLAPWPLLRSAKVIIIPSHRHFHGRHWASVEHRPLRSRADEPAEREEIMERLRPFRQELAARPLYVSLDKDAMRASEAAVNWDSGRLTSREVLDVIEASRTLAGGDLAGMDVVGDWSPVRLRGAMRRVLHWTEHPPLTIEENEATSRNESLNLRLLDAAACGLACSHC